MLGWHYALSRHENRCKAQHLDCLTEHHADCMMHSADDQGLNPNALVSSGLAPFFRPRRGEPCPMLFEKVIRTGATIKETWQYYFSVGIHLRRS